MRHSYQFDKQTGTMVPTEETVARQVHAANQKDIVQSKSDEQTAKPEFRQEKRIETKSSAPNVRQNQIVRMQRVDRPTPIQLIDGKGLPEAYLDSVTTGVMMFREREDYDVCQIVDEKTGKALAYIGGYALQFNFNMSELNTMERIEQCLQGLVKLFRHKIMSQNLRGNPTGN